MHYTHSQQKYVDPDQMALLEASLSGYTVFSK